MPWPLRPRRAGVQGRRGEGGSGGSSKRRRARQDWPPRTRLPARRRRVAHAAATRRSRGGGTNAQAAGQRPVTAANTVGDQERNVSRANSLAAARQTKTLAGGPPRGIPLRRTYPDSMRRNKCSLRASQLFSSKEYGTVSSRCAMSRFFLRCLRAPSTRPQLPLLPLPLCRAGRLAGRDQGAMPAATAKATPPPPSPISWTEEPQTAAGQLGATAHRRPHWPTDAVV